MFASSFDACSILFALGSSVANVVNLAGQGAMVVNLASPPYNLAASALRSAARDVGDQAVLHMHQEPRTPAHLFHVKVFRLDVRRLTAPV